MGLFLLGNIVDGVAVAMTFLRRAWAAICGWFSNDDDDRNDPHLGAW